MSSLTKDQVIRWSQKYDKEEDLYNSALHQELGDKLRRVKESKGFAPSERPTQIMMRRR